MPGRPTGHSGWPMHLDAPARRSPGIGLTPLIDVVFILLVFFMLATRFTVLQEAPMQLSAAGGAGAESDVVRLDIVDADRLRAGDTRIGLDELPAWLEQQRGRRLVLVPADDTSLQTTLDVMQRIEAAGHPALDVALLGMESE